MFQHFVEPKLIKNESALVMEEAGPSITSVSQLLAPEEVFAPRGELIKGKSELKKSDQRRHRRKLMRIRSKKLNEKFSKSIDKQAVMKKIVKMAHKPNSNIRIVK